MGLYDSISNNECASPYYKLIVSILGFAFILHHFAVSKYENQLQNEIITERMLGLQRNEFKHLIPPPRTTNTHAHVRARARARAHAYTAQKVSIEQICG